ncbi:sugar phosphate nucleotidyltransferase [Geitlerinema sp. CS-897]|nr:sugar phosphate nucleotidyltransferase [Geitlerinema sp. CS-897]
MNEFIGILPAAGLGSRLQPFRYAKELLPVFFKTDDRENGKRVYPRAAAEYSIQAMRHANIQFVLTVISDRKTEVIKYFSDGRDFDINIAYLHQKEPYGLSDAINKGFQWYKNSYVFLALPDTIFYPFHAIRAIREEILASQADLVLGVFPTSKPEQLGPVRFDSSGKAIEVLDKPKVSSVFNTWGIAGWSPTFSKLLNQYMAISLEAQKQPIGNIFNLAITRGLNVRTVFFKDGEYIDLGTPEGLAHVILNRELSGLKEI